MRLHYFIPDDRFPTDTHATILNSQQIRHYFIPENSRFPSDHPEQPTVFSKYRKANNCSNKVSINLVVPSMSVSF
jgi:hypothetical protein